ncbi:hypothetical protein JST97_06455 [bacterium]|nr:hypothetical protein [bacterium]
MKINSHCPMPKIPLLPSKPVAQEFDRTDRFSHLACGAASAVAGALVEGTGMAAITLRHTPAGVKRAYHDLFTSEHGPVYKGAWSLGIVAAAALATPLAGVLGLGLGAYGGAVSGYHHGVGPAISDCIQGLREYNQLVGDTMIYQPRRPQ